MERIRVTKLTGKEEINHSLWKFGGGGGETENFNASRVIGGRTFPIGEIWVVQRLRKEMSSKKGRGGE